MFSWIAPLALTSTAHNLCVRMQDRELQGFGADFMALARMSLWSAHNSYSVCVEKGPYDKVPEPDSDASWHFYLNSLAECRRHDCDKRADWYGPENDCDRHPRRLFSEAVRMLYKPNRWVRTTVEEKVDYLAPHRAVVLHVRRGDKIAGPWRETTETHQHPALEDYYRAAVDAKGAHTRLLVLADEDETITRIVAINDHLKKFEQVVYAEKEKRRGGFGFNQLRSKLTDHDLKDEALVFFSLIETMRTAGVLVGARLSSVFVIAELLRSPNQSTVSLMDNPRYPTRYIFDQ